MSTTRSAGGPLLPRLTTIAAVLAALASTAVHAQDEAVPVAEGAEPAVVDTVPVQPLREEASQLDEIEVTGSRLKRVDAEGPLPVVSISREQIDVTGNLSVSDVLREQTFNSFGSFKPSSGASGGAQGGAQIDLRGLGSERTLVLVDGRRLPNNPAFAGASQNINNIPLALVERIEILREGASAIYGSDAIGGVINVITKRDYSGLQFSTQIDRPSAKGGDGNTVTLVGGSSSAKGNYYFSVEHYDKDLVWTRDRAADRNLSSAFGYPGTLYRYSADGQTFNSREVQEGCPTGGFDSDPQFPDSAVIGNRCRFRFASIAALTAAVERDSLNVGSNYELYDDITFFSRVSFTTAKSFGRFAPAPVDSLVDGVNAPDANGNIGIRIAPDNPNNPYPGELIVLNYRPTALGPRDNTVRDQVNQYVLGVKGELYDFFGFTDWEIAGTYNRYTQRDIGLNYGLVREFQQAVDSGDFNPFDPNANPDALRQFRYTISNDNFFASKGVDARIGYDLQVADLTIPFALGAEYRDDTFAAISDSQSDQSVTFGPGDTVTDFTQSNVFGSAGGSAAGSRTYHALFLESGVQLFDSTLELGAAVRYDSYSDVGSRVSPKVSLGYRPIERVLLRGSWSGGFRAPDLTSLYGAPSKSAEPVQDTYKCQIDPTDESACDTEQRTVVFDSNPNLKPEKSESLSAGLIWNVTDDLSASVDYYDITVKDAISNLAPQAVMDNDARCRSEDPTRGCQAHQEGYVVRTADDGFIFAYIPAANAARLETNGIDVDMNYTFRMPYLPEIGNFGINAGVSRVLSYKRQDAIGGELLERLDTLNGNGEVYPKWRANSTLTWKWDAYDAALGANYIGSVRDCDVSDVEAGDPDAVCGNNFASYTAWDLQASWSTPWDGKLTVGARNLFDRQASISQYTKSTSTSGTFYNLHDIDGRVPFVRYTQNF